MNLICTIDGKPVPQYRMRRKGFALVCCSTACYQELRRIRRELSRTRTIPPARNEAQQGQEGTVRSAQSIVDEMQQ